jgi:hypothetical protein
MRITPEQRARLDQRVNEILSFDKQVRKEDEFLLAMQALSHEEEVARDLLAAARFALAHAFVRKFPQDERAFDLLTQAVKKAEGR